MSSARLPVAGLVPGLCGFLLLLLIARAGAAAAGSAPDPHAPVPHIVGWVETAWLPEPGIALEAKLDTGADTSSLHAPALERFQRAGVPWVRFTLTGNDGARHVIEKPVLRVARIRRAGTRIAERPVVLLRLCVAGITQETEFTLSDRSRLDYPLLVGRKFLGAGLAVSSSQTHAAAGRCQP
ncbi:MAG: ATP-dependent zinc protease [Methyloligellaceae bacterium]